jgi:hypothetical protein
MVWMPSLMARVEVLTWLWRVCQGFSRHMDRMQRWWNARSTRTIFAVRHQCSAPWSEAKNVLLLEALSEQRPTRCIVATGALLERGLPRDVESLHPCACMEVPSPCASCKICCQGQITQGRMPDLAQKDSNVIRYEDQEVRRSNTELTDEGPQGGPIHQH